MSVFGKRVVSPFCFVAVVAAGLLAAGTSALAQKQAPADLAKRVDAALALELPGQAGSPHEVKLSDDETFLRRVSLDLVGDLPTPEEVTAFVLDPSPDKRAKAVDRLLANERFGQNWARYFRDVILYRRTDERALLVGPAVVEFLTKELNRDTGWDKIATAFITAKGDVREEGATGLIMAQMGQAAEIAAETARIFLGVQIQCAQCHDHPTDRWKRKQFHELAAFFPRIAIRRIPDKEKRSFEVVSRDFAGKRGPKDGKPRGTAEHYMPDLNDPSAEGTMMQPVFFVTGKKLQTGTKDAQRRESLAEWITAKSEPWFARAFVNRIWAELVGEGFYEPIDDLGPDRKPSAPNTVDMLSKAFAASGYDVKWLMRAITDTEAYQRESRTRREGEGTPFVANCPQPLRADQVYDVLTGALALLDMEPPRPNRPGGGGPPGLRGPRGEFSRTFGFDPSLPRDEVAASIPQALLLMNSPVVNRAINGRNAATVLGKLLAEKNDDETVATELYLRCLAREPRPEELTACLKHVKESGDRAEAFEDVLWALVNSTEFLHRR